MVWLSHMARVRSWSGTPKYHRMVHKCPLYGTQLDSLQHSPPRMKNQHGLNEEINHLGKKISQLSACDVTLVVSLDTNNQA